MNVESVPEPKAHDVEQHPPKVWAAGVPAVAVALARSVRQMGATRTARTLTALNQREGFDCPGCAWPETPGHRKHAEFCENGAKAVAEEATTRTVGPDFFAAHSISDLRERSEYWLSQQGRITHPMVLTEGDDHYRPIRWDQAFTLIADELTGLEHPDQAAFYTSGRTSNEAAFLYQLFARSFGTNNLPDCSNMCHESSGSALIESIGIGKGSVSVPDLENADLIIIAGQNPGTNHPRMLSTLEKAKERGATIVAVNPLPEAGLLRFKDPQKVGGVIGKGTSLADQFLQIRIGGDMALFRGLAKLLLDAEQSSPGTIFDHAFLQQHCLGVEDYLAEVATVDLEEIAEATGLTEAQLRDTADKLISSHRTIICWAMGLTQQAHGVATIEELTNVLLLRGMIGKPGAGVCPVRGHSNVQGDRTMGVWEKMPDHFLDALDREFGLEVPRQHGFDTVDTIRAMAAGDIKVFIAMGGNFVSASPDTHATAAALGTCRLTVQVSTKLNASHLRSGSIGLILPTLGRTDRDICDGRKQEVTVEDSMSVVHLSRGSLPPSGTELRSEVAIISGLAEATLGPDHPVPWGRFPADYNAIRDHISRVIPGFEDFNTKVRHPDGFVLPHPPRDTRTFPTTTGKANFATNPLQWLRVRSGRVILQTMRSHDQYNTTIYGHDDRYRGIKGDRNVVLLNPDDITALGLADGQTVDLISEFDGPGGLEERRVHAFRVVAYPTPRGNAAAYYPETNPLVPLEHVAAKSNTPVSKAITVRIEAC
ncbi:FdhF/YdeP family oxidoreductase [Gordonia rubripertincta]|uniref:FdhF/YdeP family oxidoreductase n=1 Tax=Gordonia rubripertincta TaxID=36822 RepID=A0ABT4MX18_GORRU|nr:FdhF/YdeP family oxidoreductase [Gordonia rubripertincta]MCZ4550282.1 FdhF/YdeP family oxidoreductase [Gordonia rubripertincta]